MKIAIISHAQFPIVEPFAGGLEAHTHHLVKELEDQGHEVILYAKAGSDPSFHTVPLFWGSRLNKDHPLYDKAFEFTMRHIVKQDYDLIINNSLNYVPLEFHTETMPSMITIFHTPPLPKLVAVLKQQYIRNNRGYIAVSETTAKQWRKVCHQKVHVVSNGIDVSKWKNIDTMTHPSRPPKAVWMGRITPEKGTHIAIQSCIKLGLPLAIGGGIYDKAYYKSHVLPYIDGKQITYLGHLTQEQMNAAYHDADVALVTPLWEEPFGLVAVEALASGTPVAALPNGALPSIIDNKVGAVSSSEGIDDFIQAIEQALIKSRSDCRPYVESKYALDTMVESYLKLAKLYQPAETSRLSWQTYP